ncbi:MAG: hypothetical protein IPI16_20755 [Comamonadaceae bacterium]|nr:hypothetical protein [Comamonadaceae bacterium]
MAGVQRRGGTPGWRFQLAVEAIQMLDAARGTPAKGLNVADLAHRLKVDSLQLEPVIDTLLALDWSASWRTAVTCCWSIWKKTSRNAADRCLAARARSNGRKIQGKQPNPRIERS